MNNQSDEQLNVAWHVIQTTEKEDKQTRIYADSTVDFYHENITGIPFQSDFYHSDYAGPYQLIRQEKSEFEYNERGQLFAHRTWSRIPGESWSILFETLNIYDSLGNKIENIFKDFRNPAPHFSRRTVYGTEMTDQGEIPVYTRYYWDYTLKIWVPGEKSGSISTDQERYLAVWSNWNTDLNDFTYVFEEWYSWYDKEMEHKSTIRRKGYDLVNGIEFDFTREQGWNRRRDGEIILQYDTIAEGTPEYDFQNRRTTYAYFDLAECESGQPASAISVFPNPCHGVLNICAEERLGMTQIWMTDALGKVVYTEEKELSNLTLVDLEGIRPGMYFLRLNNGDLEYAGKFVLAY